MYLYVYIYIYIYIYMNICICLSLSIYIYIYIYVASFPKKGNHRIKNYIRITLSSIVAKVYNALPF